MKNITENYTIRIDKQTRARLQDKSHRQNMTIAGTIKQLLDNEKNQTTHFDYAKLQELLDQTRKDYTKLQELLDRLDKRIK